MTILHIKFEGREWLWDTDIRLTVKQGIAMHLAHGMTVTDWLGGLKTGDARSWQCTYWLMLQKNGVIKPLADCDFELFDFMSAYGEARDRAKAAGELTDDDDEDEADPTTPPPPSLPDVPPSPEPSPHPGNVHPFAPPWAGTGYSPSPSQGSAAST